MVYLSYAIKQNVDSLMTLKKFSSFTSGFSSEVGTQGGFQLQVQMMIIELTVWDTVSPVAIIFASC